MSAPLPRRVDKHGQPLVKDLRDKALLALLSLQVLRTVEIARANVDDLQRRDENGALLVRGKGHDRLIYLREDVAQAVHAYLEARGGIRVDALGLPLMTAVGNRAGGQRLSRRGVRKIVASHLRRLELKRPGL
jgi:site-specific recombinase XerD